MAQKPRRKSSAIRLTRSRLDALVAEATVDAYGEIEQLTGLFTLIEDKLDLPFETVVLGIPVIVRSVELGPRDILAVCARGKERQAVPILDLPLPSPPPKGFEWIAAYRRWAQAGG